ncbi:MAG: P-II family nitrogen regulator [Desulfuromonadales bacterium]|nr:P-II family nitrogen regulator [Desulfuromonadales bacterium]
MKEVKAYIKKHKLDRVLRALRKISGLSGLSVIDSRGYGLGWGGDGADALTESRSGVKLEIVCEEELVDQVVAAVEQAAHTGLKGDGKIYIGHIEQAVRISTGERGKKAV